MGGFLDRFIFCKEIGEMYAGIVFVLIVVLFFIAIVAEMDYKVSRKNKSLVTKNLSLVFAGLLIGLYGCYYWITII